MFTASAALAPGEWGRPPYDIFTLRTTAAFWQALEGDRIGHLCGGRLRAWSPPWVPHRGGMGWAEHGGPQSPGCCPQDSTFPLAGSPESQGQSLTVILGICPMSSPGHLDVPACDGHT